MNMDASSRQYNPPQPQVQCVVEKQEDSRSAGPGIAGFILALFGLFPLAFILSLIGLSRPRKGLAIVGLILSIIELVIVLAIFT